MQQQQQQQQLQIPMPVLRHPHWPPPSPIPRAHHLILKDLFALLEPWQHSWVQLLVQGLQLLGSCLWCQSFTGHWKLLT